MSEQMPGHICNPLCENGDHVSLIWTGSGVSAPSKELIEMLTGVEVLDIRRVEDVQPTDDELNDRWPHRIGKAGSAMKHWSVIATWGFRWREQTNEELEMVS